MASISTANLGNASPRLFASSLSDTSSPASTPFHSYPSSPVASSPASTPFHSYPSSPVISTQRNTPALGQTIDPLELCPTPASPPPAANITDSSKRWKHSWLHHTIKVIGFFICIAGLYLGVASYLQTRQSNILTRQGNNIAAWQSNKDFREYCEAKFALQPDLISAECLNATANPLINAPPTLIPLKRSILSRTPSTNTRPSSSISSFKRACLSWYQLFVSFLDSIFDPTGFNYWLSFITRSVHSLIANVKRQALCLAFLGSALCIFICVWRLPAMKYWWIAQLAQLMVMQYVSISIIISVYHPYVYFPGIRICASLALYVIDMAGYVFWRSVIRPYFSVLRDLPRPEIRGRLLTGHVGAVFSIPLGCQIAEWVNSIPHNGLITFRGMLGTEYLIVAGADSLRDVLFTRAYDFEKTSAFRRYTSRFLASGLVVQEGEAHKARRKALSPVFQAKNVDMLKPMLSKKSEQLIRALHKQLGYQDNSDQRSKQSSKGTVIDICDWATRFALDIACVVGLGDDWGLIESREVKPILAAYRTIFTGSKEKMSQYAWHNIAHPWVAKALPHRLDNAMDEAAATIDRLCKKAVAKRIDLMKGGKGQPPQDFLTDMIQSGKFKPSEVSDELLIFMAAAHESTAVVIAMAIYHLTQVPRLQVQLRQELQAFGLTAGVSSIHESQYEKLPLLNAILNETMRLEPPLRITLRKTICNTSVGGHPVRAGTYVVISPYAMGRSNDIWGPTAAQFDPHRWIDSPSSASVPLLMAPMLNQLGGATTHYSMLTFLKGPKSCTGERFAKAELRRVVAALVANFDWELEQRHQPEQTGIVVVKPENGIAVRYTPVDPVIKGQTSQ